MNLPVPNERSLTVCCGCGAWLPAAEGPVHRYMTSSAACWAAFGQVLAREYADRRLDAVHRLTVDAYAVQHPGTPSPQSTQSVAVHLCRLYLLLECGYPVDRANDVMLTVKQFEEKFRWLEPPLHRGAVNVTYLLAELSPDEHLKRVREWATCAWTAWSPHHATIRQWLPASIQRRSTLSVAPNPKLAP